MKKILLVVVAVAMFAPQAQAITWNEVKAKAKAKGQSVTQYVKDHKKELAAAGLVVAAVAAVAAGGAVAYNQSQKSKQAPMTEAQAEAALIQTAAIVEEKPAQVAVIEKENVVPVVVPEAQVAQKAQVATAVQPQQAQKAQMSTAEAVQKAELMEESKPSMAVVVEQKSSIPVPPPMPPKKEPKAETSPSRSANTQNKEPKQTDDVRALIAKKRAALNEDEDEETTSSSRSTSTGSKSVAQQPASTQNNIPPAPPAMAPSKSSQPTQRVVPSGDLLGEIQKGKQLKSVDMNAPKNADAKKSDLATSLQTGKAGQMLKQVESSDQAQTQEDDSEWN